MKSASMITASPAFVLRALPWLTLAYAVIAYLRYGIDLPYFDDWRDYASSVEGRLDLAYLFRPINGTLYPVGKLLDSTVLHAVNGNSVIYQAASMVAVLGSLLILQWKLLRAVTDDALLAASAFTLTLLMLQAGSYWGVQYLAYHQALPLVCFLFILYVWVCAEWSPPAKMLATFIVGLIAGFAYVSGAIPGIAGACVLLAVGLARPHRRDFVQAGVSLGLASLISSLAQVYAILAIQGRAALHPDAPLASPFSLDFWIYALGKVGRSLALPETLPVLSLTVAAAAALAVVAFVGFAVHALLRWRAMNSARENQFAITLFLAIIIGVYLCMVTAVRSNLRFPTVVTSLDLFIFAFGRFHFFWLALLWPWLFLLCLQALPQTPRRLVAPVFAGVIAVALLLGGRLDHGTAFAGSQTLKTAALECIRAQLLTANMIACPTAVKGNLARHYANAVEVDASFVRSAPPSLRKFNPSPAFSVMASPGFNETTATLANVEDVRWQGETVAFRSTGDAQITFRTGQPERLKDCLVLYVSGMIDSAAPETAQLYYLPLGSPGFSADYQATSPVGSGQPAEFIVKSVGGFQDLLRLDPIAEAGQATLSDVNVRCLVERMPR